MTPWKMAAILAATWFALVILVAVVHTELVIRDITPERDEALSYRYGQAAGGRRRCTGLRHLGL